ncbi:WD40/YVTN/BNR-like repeat-containing protein [Paenibacillus lautus]|uniref:WD40/YVTN/BNR-like repeat-containing protein n=1 Tax=Paenibacillus lautus TaxID=1401 RepID=UPI003D285962
MIKPRIGFSFMLSMLVVVSLSVGCQPTDEGNVAQHPVHEQSVISSNENTPETELPSGSASGGDDTAGSSVVAVEDTDVSPDHQTAEPDVDLADVTAVRLINHSSGWIGGEGWIAFSDNGGTEWEVQAQPKGTVRQIFALNGKQAWTVMENNDLYRTTDGGETWIWIGSTPNAGFLHFISPETGFSGQAKTEDGGKTWSDQDIPDTTIGSPTTGAITDGAAEAPKNVGAVSGPLYVVNTRTHN